MNNKIISITTASRQLHLVHDRLVVRTAKGELLQRCTPDETMALLCLADTMAYNERCCGKTIALPAETAAVMMGPVEIVLVFARHKDGIMNITSADLRRLMGGLEANLGKDAFVSRRDSCAWREGSGWPQSAAAGRKASGAELPDASSST